MQEEEQMYYQCPDLNTSELISSNFVTAVAKKLSQQQHLHLEINGKVWVPTHYFFQLIYNALHTALGN